MKHFERIQPAEMAAGRELVEKRVDLVEKLAESVKRLIESVEKSPQSVEKPQNDKKGLPDLSLKRAF
ncbi:hypothetical protein ACQCVA_08050 [Bacillus infantis]